MTARRLAAMFFVLCAAVALWQFLTHFGELPARVVTRFDSQGNPETVISKAYFAALYLGLLVGATAYFVASYAFAHRLPQRYLRFLPHHAYWLEDSRRAATLASVSTLLCWIAALTLATFTISFGFMLAANTGRPIPYASTISSILDTLYLSGLFVLAIIFRRRFGRLPREGD